MENASKALIIAGGVILAVIIMSLIAYFFTSISEWPQQQDDTESKEQLAKFNQEYEVYEKSAMYGTDVISCLNKVVNFDEKYVEENNTENEGDYKSGWLSGTKYGEKKEFAIDVSVTLNEELEESLEVYYLDLGRESSTSNKEQLRYYTTPGEPAKIEDAFKYLLNNPDEIKKERNAYGSFFTNNQSGDLYTQTPEKEKAIVKAGTYSLLKDKTINTSGTLYELIKLSKFDLKVTIKNKDTDPSSLRKWSTVVWKTPLYDFKSKRFRCDRIEYNAQTGRVNKISFSEI